MNGHRIYPSNYIKYLGVYLDPLLNGKAHCEILMKKLKRSNGMLSKARHFVPFNELKTIYYAIFSSHMIFGSQVWGQSKNVFNEKVHKLQNKAMRIITFADFQASSDPIFKYLKILKLQDFITLQNCLFVHDSLNDNLPLSFDNYFKSVTDVHTIDTRSAALGCLFVTHANSTKFGLNSITRKCIDDWNHFSKLFNVNLRYLSRSMLKRNLTSYFLDNYQLVA